MTCECETRAVEQVERGTQRPTAPPRQKVAAASRQVQVLVKAGVRPGESEIAALVVVARMFWLRVPSEGILLEWSGSIRWS